MPSAAPVLDDRDLLEFLAAGPVSGDTLASRFGLTRAAVWKRIHALRGAGIAISAVRGSGYALEGSLDLLDADRLCAGLAPEVRADIAALDVAWRTGSTNTDLLAEPAPVKGCRVRLAEQQTAGRGRRGRAWASPLAAHVYLSVSRRFEGGLARLGGLSLVAGVAVAQALRACTGADVRIKWPNDLVVGGRKLGGILVEGGGEHGSPVRAVVGIGINVTMPLAAAAGIDQPWIDLREAAGEPLDRTRVATAVIDHLVPALGLFDAAGLAPFLPQYRALDALDGHAIDVIGADARRQAVALGIADDGGLQVRHADDGSTAVLHAGEVSVRRA